MNKLNGTDIPYPKREFLTKSKKRFRKRRKSKRAIIVSKFTFET